MIARLTILLACAIGVTALAAGCGGGDSANTAAPLTTSSMSKAQFVKKASAICSKGREEILSFESQSNPNSPNSEFEEGLVQSLIPTLRRVAGEIRELGAPQGDASQIEAFLVSMEKGLTTIEEKSSSLSSLSDVEVQLKPSSKLVRAYGLGACSF